MLCRLAPIVAAVLGLAGCSTGDDASASITTTVPRPLVEADAPGDVVMPTPETTGPSNEALLRPLHPDEVDNGGRYVGVRITGGIDLGPGDLVVLEECVVEGSILTSAPLELRSCRVEGGIYPTGADGVLERVLVDSTGGQALRPLAQGYFEGEDPFSDMAWRVEDSYLRIPAGGPGAHVESVQILGGRGHVFRNVVFDTGCPFNNTQTADLSLHAADTLVEDSWFVGCAGFALYSDGPGVRIVRPRVLGDYEWGFLYRDPGSNRVDPVVEGLRDRYDASASEE